MSNAKLNNKTKLLTLSLTSTKMLMSKKRSKKFVSFVNSESKVCKFKIYTVGSQFRAQTQLIWGTGPKSPETMNL